MDGMTINHIVSIDHGSCGETPGCLAILIGKMMAIMDPWRLFGVPKIWGNPEKSWLCQDRPFEASHVSFIVSVFLASQWQKFPGFS